MHGKPQILVLSEGPEDWHPRLANSELHWKPGHRTASAIYGADRFNAGSAAMIAHSFFPEGKNEENDGFNRIAVFCAFLGVADAERSRPMWTTLSTG